MHDEIQSRLRKIKLLALDVDGVLTDGRVFWIKGQGWTRSYHVRDGHGMIRLMKAGIHVAFISAGDSEDLYARCEKLGITRFYFGSHDKLPGLRQMMEKDDLSFEQVAYVGDELFDLPILEKVGFSASVPEAIDVVRSKVHYVTQLRGGDGAVREIADMILKAQGKE